MLGRTFPFFILQIISRQISNINQRHDNKRANAKIHLLQFCIYIHCKLNIYKNLQGIKVISFLILSALLNLSKSKWCNLSVNGSFPKNLPLQITICSIRARKRIEGNLFCKWNNDTSPSILFAFFDYTFCVGLRRLEALT